jgi:class 3 adenylate cyclase
MAKKTWDEIRIAINSILNSPTPIQTVEHIPTSDSEFTYDNGIKASVSSVFIDIVDSSSLFKMGKDIRLAKILRAFVQESIEIIRNNSHYREIGIRGDSVFAVFDTPSKADCKDVFVTAIQLNSLLQLLEKLVYSKYQIKLTAGIGIGYDSSSLIVKTGISRSGVYDNVWLGDAVVDASNLSGISNRKGRKRIIMSKSFYDYVIDDLLSRNPNYRSWITSFYIEGGLLYETNVYNSDVEELLK